MTEKWYKKSYRRNLVDMHIQDWDDVFLSEFSPQAYVECLKKGRVKSAMLYFQSHVGLCYYPTKVGVMHRAFAGREDMMRRLVELCHENGIDVIGYYSLCFNTREEERHPEWRLTDGCGEQFDTSAMQRGGRYGHCCPNNAEYRAFVQEQIREISAYFHVEGMFFDMTFWSGICHCPSCRQRFTRETGIAEIPTAVDWKNSAWVTLQKKRLEWIAEFAAWVTGITKELMPHVSVEHNYAFGVAGDFFQASCEGVNDACDYSGGDLYGDSYNHTFTAKYYRSVSKDQPFEYMTSRFPVDLLQHTLCKTPHELTADVMITTAHHGASFVIDAIDPCGSLNPHAFSVLGEAFAAVERYEPYLVGEPIEDAAIFYSVTGRYNSEGQPHHARVTCVELMKSLVRSHVLTGVLSASTLHRVGRYPVVFAPDAAGLTDAERDALCTYVQEGGVLYFSGAEEPALLQRFFNARVDAFTPVSHTYIAPVAGYEPFFGGFNARYPIPTGVALPVLQEVAEDAEVMAHITLPYGAGSTRWSAIHSNPPAEPTQAPAFLTRAFGRGHVYWSAAPLETEHSTGVPQIYLQLLNRHLPLRERTLLTDAPARVELLAYREENAVTLNIVDLLSSGDDVRIYPFSVSVKLARAPQSISLLPDGKTLPFQWENGFVTFETEPLHMFAIYKITL